MHVYKLLPSHHGEKRISRESFEADTQKKYPWYQPGNDEVYRQYAVCPACNNPVQLIGLYKKLEHTDKPYGKHTGKPIPGFPLHNPEDYEWCPYIRNKTQLGKKQKKKKVAGLPSEIRKLVIKHFDSVIHVIGEAVGMEFSINLSRNILDTYLGEEGYLYVGATLQNVPWIVAYMADSKPLFGQRIVANAELLEAIKNKVPHANIDANGRLSKGSRYYSLHACFIHHKQEIHDGVLSESLSFVITDDRNQEVFKKSIPFDVDFFDRLISEPQKNDIRSRTLRAVAKEAALSRGLNISET